MLCNLFTAHLQTLCPHWKDWKAKTDVHYPAIIQRHHYNRTEGICTYRRVHSYPTIHWPVLPGSASGWEKLFAVPPSPSQRALFDTCKAKLSFVPVKKLFLLVQSHGTSISYNWSSNPMTISAQASIWQNCQNNENNKITATRKRDHFTNVCHVLGAALTLVMFTAQHGALYWSILS